MNPTISVSVVVGNVRNNPPMPQEDVVEDVETLHAMGQVVLACEIGKRRYDRAFRRAADENGRRAFFERSAVQVSVPRRWPVHTRKHRLTLGIAGINPSRYMNIVFCDATKVAFASIHMTNGAWNLKRKPMKRWRRWAWNRQQRRARAIVADLRRLGWTVVIGGDMNRRTAPRFHDKQQLVASASAIIHLVVVPASGVKVTWHGIVRKRGNSDHAFVRATLLIADETEDRA